MAFAWNKKPSHHEMSCVSAPADGQFVQTVHRPRCLLDVIDEEWLADTLSDDDIEIPPEQDHAPDDHDGIDLGDKAASKTVTTEKWTELALQQFLDDKP